MNVCGCNQRKMRCEIGDIMCKRDMDVMGHCETKLQLKGEKTGRFKGMTLGVAERMCVREGIATVLGGKSCGEGEKK